MSDYSNMTLEQKLQTIDLLIETKDQAKEIAVLEYRIKLMSITQERQRAQIKDYQITQAGWLDDLCKADLRIEIAEAAIHSVGNGLIVEYNEKCKEQLL